MTHAARRALPYETHERGHALPCDAMCTCQTARSAHAHAETILAMPLDRWFFNSAMSPVPAEMRKPDVAEAGLQQCVQRASHRVSGAYTTQSTGA